MNTFQICLPHLSDAATLLWEIQVIFQHILHIIYVTSEENK